MFTKLVLLMLVEGNNRMRVPVWFDSTLKLAFSAMMGNVNKRLCFNSAGGGKGQG